MHISLLASLCLALSLSLNAVILARAQNLPWSRHLADYDSELRGSGGRVDTDKLVMRLSTLGITTYYWLIWHAPTDWDDLKVFLPKANRAGLEVWVYLVPPTEAPPQYPAPEPFALDYFRWAEEIARLSIQHTNLTGWVIDDFYANHQLFTPAYIRDMQGRAKKINPRLLFLPLMYFGEINPRFVKDYQTAIDGVVVAYPRDRDEILNARAVLNGAASVLPGQLECSWNTPTRKGDFVAASIETRVLSPKTARLRFREQDDFTAATAGYHFKQVLVDGAVAWEEDAAGGTNGWREISLDLAPLLHGKTNATLSLRLFDKLGVSNFGIRWRVRDLSAEGFTGALSQFDQWRVDQHGPFGAGFGPALHAPRNTPSVRVPFIVMTAGDAGEFRLRHGEPASPERMAEWLRMCLDLWREGQCDGVVTYCLDKRPDSRIFPLAQDLFHRR